MRARPLAALAAVLLVVAGCGGSGTSDETTSTTARRSLVANGGLSRLDIRIGLSEYLLSPANVRLGLPGVYTFLLTNEGHVPHAFVIEQTGAKAQTRVLEPGSTATLKVDLTEPGDYEIYCPIDGHRAKGMEGTVVRDA